MMMCDDLHQIRSKSPALSKDSAAIAMGQIQHSSLGLMQRNLLSASELKCFAKFFWQDPKIYNDAKVVKKSTKVSLFRLGEINFPGEMAAHQRTPQRVFPEHNRIELRFSQRQQLEKAAGDNDFA